MVADGRAGRRECRPGVLCARCARGHYPTGTASIALRDAGMTILRTAPGAVPEIWCRCDGGPHGYLAIAAHAHADALSIEVRCGGIDVLADPGTYCYFGEPEWRRYFRSTVAHNTLELDGVDQSQSGGPFLWLGDASSKVLDVALESHDGSVVGSPTTTGICALIRQLATSEWCGSTPIGTDLR